MAVVSLIQHSVLNTGRLLLHRCRAVIDCSGLCEPDMEPPVKSSCSSLVPARVVGLFYEGRDPQFGPPVTRDAHSFMCYIHPLLLVDGTKQAVNSHFCCWSG